MAFVGTRGRCTERGFLDFHHLVPFADGGAAVVDDSQLRCKADNQDESERWFSTQEPPVVREVPRRLGLVELGPDRVGGSVTLPRAARRPLCAWFKSHLAT
jgi:hypothetical protein